MENIRATVQKSEYETRQSYRVMFVYDATNRMRATPHLFYWKSVLIYRIMLISFVEEIYSGT